MTDTLARHHALVADAVARHERYSPIQGPEQEQCDKCQRWFGTLAEVFSHTCEALGRFATISNGFGGTTTVKRTDARADDGSNVEPAARPDGPTEKQIDYIRKLNAERGVTGEACDLVISLIDTKRKASKIIDTLIATPKYVAPAPAVETPAPAKPAAKRMNKFAGKCGVCGKRVEAEAGDLERIDEKWVVTHHDGECPSSFPFPEGSYALEHDDAEPGTNRVRFYDCREGVITLRAGDDSLPVRNRQEIVDLIAADPEAASARYGRELGCCGICSRTLTNDHSRQRGIGPVCASKAGW